MKEHYLVILLEKIKNQLTNEDFWIYQDTIATFKNESDARKFVKEYELGETELLTIFEKTN